MILNEEQSKVKALLTEAITVLCKNGLQYREEFSIEGLLGITLDNEDVFLISINELVKNDLAPVSMPKLGPASYRQTATKHRPSPGLYRSTQNRPHKRPFHAVSSSVQQNSQSPHSSTQVGSTQDSSEPPIKKPIAAVAGDVVEIESDSESGGGAGYRVKPETCTSDTEPPGEEDRFPPEPGEGSNTSHTSVPNTSNDLPAQPNDSVPNFGDELNISDMSVNLKSEPGLSIEPAAGSSSGEPSQAMMFGYQLIDDDKSKVMKIMPQLGGGTLNKRKRVYDHSTLLHAIDLVRYHGMSQNKAAKTCGVPQKTLNRWINKEKQEVAKIDGSNVFY